jgi:F-type H+-transporting ATPase subunit epsilon
MPLLLEIVTPDSIAFSDKIDSVVLPTANGRIDVLPRHIPIIDRTLSGYVEIIKNGERDFIIIGPGFIEVFGDKVSIITDRASKVAEDEEDEIEQAIKKAQETLSEAKDSNIDKVQIELLEATARFEMAKKIAKNKTR